MKKSSTNSNPEVSIIIVNYNTGKLLKECIESVVKYTNNLQTPKTEIIVVDNNSTDESTHIKGSFNLIKNSSNPGFAKANNQGIKLAKGKYVMLLNADTKFLGNVIDELVKFAESHPEAGVIVPRLLNSDKSVQDSVMPFPTIFRAIQEFWFGQKVYSKFAPSTVKPIEVEAAVMAAFLITPQALEKVGLLNEEYFMYFEDLDYCREVQKTGLKIYYLPQVEVIHYHGVSGKALSDFDNQWRRLIPGSKIYNGLISHYLLFIIARLGQIVRGK